MYVTDLARMNRFYVDALGFTVTDRGSLESPRGTVQLIFLSRDPDEHHQLVLASGRPASIDFNPINQISLKTSSITGLRALRRRVLQHGATEISTVTHGNAVSIYCRDPEANRLELYMDLPWYVSQPMREPVDLEGDEKILMQSLEAHARSLPGFEPRSSWRERMVRMMATNTLNQM
jgi:catechol 2,3-dioxygenase-like lactoylglutathione lyase family enzyme